MTHRVVCPGRRFICVARNTRIGNLVLIGHRGRDEPECVRVNHGVSWPFRFNRWHVARDTLASRAAVFVMRVFFKSSGARPIGRRRTMTIQTNLVGGLPELRVISGAVSVVTIEACDSAPVHHALHEIVSLHPVLVCGSIRIVKKSGGRAESMIF